MDSFELNKIVGAILGTLLLVMGVGFLAEAIYEPIQDRGVGYVLPEPEPIDDGAVAVVEEVVPLAVLLASASAEKGAGVARKCQSCHNFDEGAGSKAGPPLYGIVNAAIASFDGYSYSEVLSGLGASGDTWTYENLSAFLASPKTFSPGTKMTFAGLRKETDVADMLAYMQSLSAAPVAFPEVVEMPAEDVMADEAMADDAMADEAVADVSEDVAAAHTADTMVEEVADTTDTMVEEAATTVEEMVDPEMDINSAVESGSMSLPADAPVVVPAAE